MNIYDQLFTAINTRERKRDELADEYLSITCVDYPHCEGQIDRNWQDLTLAEQKRIRQIDDLSDRLMEQICKVQRMAEEYLTDEQLARMAKEIGTGNWEYYQIHDIAFP